VTRLTRATRIAAIAMVMVVSSLSRMAAQTTTVILVRHAEKAATPPDDPPLTAAGEARARELWEALKDARVTAIITTQFARTRATAQPTATALGVTPDVVNAAGTNHPQDVAAAVRKHAGQTVLVVGHSNTVPSIIEALGATKPAAICDGEYDNLYIVTLGADGKAGVVRSKFGARAPADACAGMK
jgi:broad specificity phosphatase PhoE